MRALLALYDATALGATLIAVGICGLFATPALAQDPSAKPGDLSGRADDAQLRFYDRGVSSEGRAFLRIVLPKDHSASVPAVFRGEMLAPKDLGTVEAVLDVWNAEGAAVAQISIRTHLSPGSVPLHFEWNARALPDGLYTGSISLYRGAGKALARRSFLAAKRSRTKVEEEARNAQYVLQDLKNLLRGSDAPLGSGSSALHGRLRLFEDALLDATLQQDRFQVHDIAMRVQAEIVELRARWGDDLKNAAMAGLPPLRNLTRAGSRFVSRGRPVFLAGLVVQGDPASLEKIGNYGLGLGVIAKTGESDVADWSKRVAVLDRAATRHNVALIQLLAREDRSPETLSTLSKALEGRNMFVALGLSGRPRIDIVSPEMRAGFIEYTKETYRDRFELNRAWRKRLKSLDDIDIWPNYDGGSYQVDWQIFLRERVTAKMAETNEAIRREAPGVALMAMLDENFLVPGESRRGIDHEALLRSAQITALESAGSFADPVFASAYPNQSLRYALLRSLRPESILVAVHRLELPTLAGAGLSRDTHAFVWESAMEGVAALALDIEAASADSSPTISDRFHVLDGFVIASDEVNRLAGIVDSFRQAPAAIAILWSDSSRVLDGGGEHLASLRRAYEGCSFVGHGVRFISEGQLARHEWEGIEILIVPRIRALRQDAFDALQDFVDSGRSTVRTTQIIAYDGRGRAQIDTIRYGSGSGLVRGKDVSTDYLDAMDEAISYGQLSEVPRIINRSGYPIEGVKTRYLRRGGEEFLYLINLRKDAITCQLAGEVSGGHDLIGGMDVTFPRLVPPLEPMLIRLEGRSS